MKDEKKGNTKMFCRGVLQYACNGQDGRAEFNVQGSKFKVKNPGQRRWKV